MSDISDIFPEGVGCSICLMEYSEDLKIELNEPCGHSYCKECWEKQNHCPLCRQPKGKLIANHMLLTSLKCSEICKTMFSIPRNEKAFKCTEHKEKFINQYSYKTRKFYCENCSKVNSHKLIKIETLLLSFSKYNKNLDEITSKFNAQYYDLFLTDLYKNYCKKQKMLKFGEEDDIIRKFLISEGTKIFFKFNSLRQKINEKYLFVQKNAEIRVNLDQITIEDYEKLIYFNSFGLHSLNLYCDIIGNTIKKTDIEYDKFDNLIELCNFPNVLKPKNKYVSMSKFYQYTPNKTHISETSKSNAIKISESLDYERLPKVLGRFDKMIIDVAFENLSKITPYLNSDSIEYLKINIYNSYQIQEILQDGCLLVQMKNVKILILSIHFFESEEIDSFQLIYLNNLLFVFLTYPELEIILEICAESHFNCSKIIKECYDEFRVYSNFCGLKVKDFKRFLEPMSLPAPSELVADQTKMIYQGYVSKVDNVPFDLLDVVSKSIIKLETLRDLTLTFFFDSEIKDYFFTKMMSIFHAHENLRILSIKYDFTRSFIQKKILNEQLKINTKSFERFRIPGLKYLKLQLPFSLQSIKFFIELSLFTKDLEFDFEICFSYVDFSDVPWIIWRNYFIKTIDRKCLERILFTFKDVPKLKAYGKDKTETVINKQYIRLLEF